MLLDVVRSGSRYMKATCIGDDAIDFPNLANKLGGMVLEDMPLLEYIGGGGFIGNSARTWGMPIVNIPGDTSRTVQPYSVTMKGSFPRFKYFSDSAFYNIHPLVIDGHFPALQRIGNSAVYIEPAKIKLGASYPGTARIKLTGLGELTAMGKDIFHNFAGPVHMAGDLKAMTASFVPRQIADDNGRAGIHVDAFHGQWGNQFTSEICASGAGTSNCKATCTVADASNGVDDDGGGGDDGYVAAGLDDDDDEVGIGYPPASVTLIPAGRTRDNTAAPLAGTYHLTQCNTVVIGDDQHVLPAYLRAADDDGVRFALRFYGWLDENECSSADEQPEDIPRIECSHRKLENAIYLTKNECIEDGCCWDPWSTENYGYGNTVSKCSIDWFGNGRSNYAARLNATMGWEIVDYGRTKEEGYTGDGIVVYAESRCTWPGCKGSPPTRRFPFGTMDFDRFGGGGRLAKPEERVRDCAKLAP